MPAAAACRSVEPATPQPRTHNARLPPEQLHRDPDAEARRRARIEDELAIGHRGHHERSVRTERAPQGGDQPERTALDRARCAKRRVDEEHAASLHTQIEELLLDLADGNGGHGPMVRRITSAGFATRPPVGPGVGAAGADRTCRRQVEPAGGVDRCSATLRRWIDEALPRVYASGHVSKVVTVSGFRARTGWTLVALAESRERKLARVASADEKDVPILNGLTARTDVGSIPSGGDT